MRVLLLGARSQLGHDILRTWTDDEITPLGHAECDVTDPSAVRSAVAAHAPELVVSLAASHRVDDLERDPTDGLRVNAYGAWCVAHTAAEAGAGVMWVSTDYVFAGDAGRPYTEDDRTAPVNVYGASKSAGEQMIALANPRHVIVRSSGLYGVAGASGKGGNFVETMLRLAREGKPIRVVADQVLGPTSTADLAAAMREVAGTGFAGTVHITNQGALSWHDFAALVFRLCSVRADLSSTTSDAYGAPARRPTYSVLANRRLGSLGIAQPRPVAEALRDYLHNKGHISA